MVLVISDEELKSLIDLTEIANVIKEAQVKQDHGSVERPERPHYHIGSERQAQDDRGTGLVMPAYIHGSNYFATKLVSLYESNTVKELPTLHAQLVLSDSHTGEPVSFMNGKTITNARTSCIGGLAAQKLANKPVDLAIIGAGTQARWQARAVNALCDVSSISLYSPSDSKHAAVDELASFGISATAAESADSAVRNANTVITATTSTHPVFSTEALKNGTLIVGIGAFQPNMQELEPGVFDSADQIFADVPEEAIETGDLIKTPLREEELTPLGDAFEGHRQRDSENHIIVVESVGSAVFDAAAGSHLYTMARDEGVGTDIDL